MNVDLFLDSTVISLQSLKLTKVFMTYCKVSFHKYQTAVANTNGTKVLNKFATALYM